MQFPATMSHPTNGFAPLTTLKLEDRRSFGRYHLPVSLLVEARWNGHELRLEHAPDYEDISATGAALVLARGPVPPVDAELDVTIPLLERPFQPGRSYAQCRGRVVRHVERNRLAVYFEDVKFIREERASGIPDSLFATA